MAGVDLNVTGIEALANRMQMYVNHSRFDSLLESIGAEVESQTHRRINDEKESPNGKPWADWSSGYAENRHGGHSLLMNEGELDDSVQYLVTDNEVEVGTNLIYAGLMHYGGEKIDKPQHKARAFVGLSDENISELQAIVDNWADAI
ncbi:phage virion morphogenesis protein [Pseudomonas sp. HK3]